MPEPTRRNFGIRLPVELIEAIEARAKATGQTKTETVEAILRDSLGMESGNDGGDVGQRLADVEQRLAIVERRLASSNAAPVATPPQTAATPGNYPAAPPKTAKAKPAPSGDSQNRADGVTLLTTTQAWEHCRGLGYGGGKDAFRGWAKRHPADLLRLYGLEATGYQGKDNTAASYRKV